MQKVFITDMDDVLVNLLETWLQFLNNMYHYDVKVEDVVDWDMQLAYPELDPDNIYGILREEALWKNVKPKYDAIYYLKKIQELGYKIYVATASSHNTIQTKLINALFPYFEFLNRDNIIMIHDKSLLNGDIIVDDYHENLRNAKGVRILMDAPYNQNIDKSLFDYRVHDWETIYQIAYDEMVVTRDEQN